MHNYPKIPVHDVISLLNDLKSKNTAIQDTFRDYATFLKDWVEGDNLPPLPNINIAIMHKWPMRRRRESSVSKPSTAKEARDTVTGVFGGIGVVLRMELNGVITSLTKMKNGMPKFTGQRFRTSQTIA